MKDQSNLFPVCGLKDFAAVFRKIALKVSFHTKNVRFSAIFERKGIVLLLRKTLISFA